MTGLHLSCFDTNLKFVFSRLTGGSEIHIVFSVILNDNILSSDR